MKNNITMSRENAIKLVKLMRTMIERDVNLIKFLDESSLISFREPIEVDEYFQGVSNGFLSEVIHALTGNEVEVIGKVEVLLACPCCGFKTLTELFNTVEATGYDICSYCGWEDDGTNDETSYRSINHGSISDYLCKIQENPNKYYIDKWLKD